MTRVSEGDETQRLTLTKWVHGGLCLAHVDSDTWLVSGGIPGEVVDVHVARRARGVVFAHVTHVVSTSPDRVAPPCIYADRCGGCDLQYLSLHEQRIAKRTVVIDALNRIGRERDCESLVEPTVVLGAAKSAPARDGLAYRSRIRLSQQGMGEWGLFAERSHTVVPIERCIVCVDEINESWDSFPLDASVLTVSASEGSVSMSTPQTSEACTRTVEGIDGRSWRWLIPADAFWQVHRDLPQYLVDAVSRYVTPGSVWWDLYGGAGLMSAGAVSAGASSVHLVERDTRSISSAKTAFAHEGRVHIHSTDVATWLRAQEPAVFHDAGPMGVVLDPPRAGAGAAVVSAIASAHPEVIVYVACDPASLARDTATLRDLNYRLRRVQPIDAFPMTHHVETIAVFAPEGDHSA